MLADVVQRTFMPAAVPSSMQAPQHRLAAARVPRLPLMLCVLVAGLPRASSACTGFGDAGCFEAGDTASLLQSSLPHGHKAARSSLVPEALADLLQLKDATEQPPAAQLLQKVRSITQSAITSGARVDPATIQVVSNLTQLLNQSAMLAINTGLSEDQSEVNGLVGAINACTVATLNETEASNKRSDLGACLGAQSSMLAAKNNAATALSAFLTSLPAPDAPPAAASRTVANIRTYFQSLTAYVNTNSAQLEALDAAAQAAAAALDAQKPVCTSKQGIFEVAMCTLGADSVAICDSYTACYNAAKTGYESAQPGLQESEAARKAQYVALQKTFCYLNILKSDDTAAVKQQQITACDGLTVSTAFLDVTYPSTPAAKTCTTVTKLPCTVDYKTSEYDSYSDWKTDLAAACAPCP